MSHRMIWLVAAALVLSGAFWLLQRSTPLKPPFGPDSERFESVNPHTEPRFSEIMEALRRDDETELGRLEATEAELEDARVALQALESLSRLRQRGEEALGDDYVHLYIGGRSVIVSVRPSSETDTTVVVISHSGSELTAMFTAIGDQIREREIVEAQVELPQGGRVVRVCAEENSGLDLSDFPATAVVWTGACP